MTSKRRPPCDTCPCPAWGMECKDVRTDEPQTAEPTIRPVTYAVSLLPEDHRDAHLFEVRVEARAQRNAPDLWAVAWMGRCLGADGEWDYEPIPSSRTDEWLAEHRFDLATAQRLAKQAAPNVEVNGRTAAAIWAQQ